MDNFTTILRNGKKPRKTLFYYFPPGKGNKAFRRLAKQFQIIPSDMIGPERIKHTWLTNSTIQRRIEMEPHFLYAIAIGLKNIE